MNKSKLQTWPKDWDLHVIKTCDLYFDYNSEAPPVKYVGSNVSFCYLSGKTNQDARELVVIEDVDLCSYFQMGQNEYGVTFNYIDGYVVGSVFRIIQPIIDMGNIEQDDEYSLIFLGSSLYQGKILEELIEDSAFQCAEQVEGIIRRDYWKRDDSGGDDETPNPALDPNLCLVA
tara:strand:- start:1033 stop:1554 length:522 start_codon:yes stop_codon:yes gene_type:complete